MIPRSNRRRVISLIAVFSVIILILPHLIQAKPGPMPDVDVGHVFNGEDANLSWNEYAWSGIHLFNITSSGILSFKFENGTNSQVMLNSTRVGTLHQGTTTIILVQVGLVSQMDLKFQAIDGLTVKVSKYTGNLTIPDGGLYITGTTEASINGIYRASFQFPSNYGYLIETDTGGVIQEVGIVYPKNDGTLGEITVDRTS